MTAQFFGIAVCRHCGDDYSPADEDDDICCGCKTATPPALHTAECRRYGQQTGRPEFCIAECGDLRRAEGGIRTAYAS